MSRINKRFSTPATTTETLTHAASLAAISKSELVNRALAAFTDNLPAALLALIDNKPDTSAPIMTSYMLDSLLLSKMDEQAAKLYLSREQFLRLALDYYLKYYDPDQTDEHKLAR